MTEPVTFWVPTLPARALSSNGGGRSRRNPWEVAEAKMQLGGDAHIAALAALSPALPHFDGRVDISLTFHIKPHAKPQDGLLRSLDPSNCGGEPAKCIIDHALVQTGIIADDDYKHVRYVVLSIEPVAELRDEGIAVLVREIVP